MKNNKGTGQLDMFVAIKKQDYSEENIRNILDKIIRRDCQYVFPGFIFHPELAKIIRDEHIIPQGYC